jgi:hypothetical protein
MLSTLRGVLLSRSKRTSCRRPGPRVSPVSTQGPPLLQFWSFKDFAAVIKGQCDLFISILESSVGISDRIFQEAFSAFQHSLKGNTMGSPGWNPGGNAHQPFGPEEANLFRAKRSLLSAEYHRFHPASRGATQGAPPAGEREERDLVSRLY